MNMKNYIQITEIPKIRFAHIFGTDDYWAKFEPSAELSYFIEITYITKGELIFFKENSSPVPVSTGSLICRVQYETLFCKAAAYHEHHTVGFHVPYRLLPPPDTEEDEEERPFGTLCLPLILPALPENNKFLPLIDEIILSHTMHDTGDLVCSALVLKLLGMIDQYAREEQSRPTYLNRKYVKRTKQYIFEHLKEPICQGDIAEQLGITPEYLCNVFKKSEGISVMQFVNRVKLEQIRGLMQNRKASLAEAAELYGYGDPNYVSRLHKRYFRCTITEALRRETDGSHMKSKKSDAD